MRMGGAVSQENRANEVDCGPGRAGLGDFCTSSSLLQLALQTPGQDELSVVPVASLCALDPPTLTSLPRLLPPSAYGSFELRLKHHLLFTKAITVLCVFTSGLFVGELHSHP